MKKITGLVLLAFVFVFLIGCTKDVDLSKESVDANTIVIKEDGKLQVAIVDSFDEDYYEIKEFEEFINTEIDKYNADSGEDSIIVDAIEQKDEKVTVVLTYSNVEHYSAFNSIDAHLTNGATAKDEEVTLPESFLNKKGETITTTEGLGKDEYKIFAIKENIKVIVNGKILYYSGGDYISSSSLQSSDEDMIFIIYKDTIF